MKTLHGHCAMVTGAASGIGFCFCRELASRKCNLVMIDINRESLEEKRRDLMSGHPGLMVSAIAVDLTSPDSVALIEKDLQEASMHPDILINNAGIFNFQCASDLPSSRINCYIDLHIRSVTMLSLWFAKLNWGCSSHILNMSSMSSWMPMPGIAMYSSTKAYIRVFSRALHYELKETGCMVTVACPGGIATDLFGLSPSLKRLAVRIGAIESPEKFTCKAIDKMLKGRKQYINGMVNRLAIIAVAMTPTPLRMAIKHLLLDKGIKV